MQAGFRVIDQRFGLVEFTKVCQLPGQSELEMKTPNRINIITVSHRSTSQAKAFSQFSNTPASVGECC